MDFTCPRPSQGKNCFQMQVREGSDGSSQDSAGSKPTGKGTKELVTFTGSRAREHQDQPCFPAGSRASALGISVTMVPLPSKTGDLEFKHQWKSVQNIQNIFLVELKFISVRDASPQTDTQPAARGAIPVSLRPCSLPGARFSGGWDGACRGDDAPSPEHRGTKPGTDPGGWGGLCWPLQPAEPGAEPRPGDALITKPFV